MQNIKHDDLVKTGAHLGHLKRKWNPNMEPYIFMEKEGIHVIDLNKTLKLMQRSAQALKELVKRGQKVLFVGTKTQAQEYVEEHAERLNMPYVTDRWYGGMLTNFSTIRRSIKKMKRFDQMSKDGTFDNITKKERLKILREKAKLEKSLGGIADMKRLPAALFIVDTIHEHIAVREAKRLNITTFALVDTNADPNDVDYPIPTNDDSTTAIKLMVDYFAEAVEEGLTEREKQKEKLKKEKAKKKKKKKKKSKKGKKKKGGKKKKKSKKKSKSKKSKKKGKKQKKKQSKKKGKKSSKKKKSSSKKSGKKTKKSKKSKKKSSGSSNKQQSKKSGASKKTKETKQQKKKKKARQKKTQGNKKKKNKKSGNKKSN